MLEFIYAMLIFAAFWCVALAVIAPLLVREQRRERALADNQTAIHSL